MPAYKDKNGTWYAMVRYTDWRGEKKQKCQRGFETRRDAFGLGSSVQAAETGGYRHDAGKLL